MSKERETFPYGLLAHMRHWVAWIVGSFSQAFHFFQLHAPFCDLGAQIDKTAICSFHNFIMCIPDVLCCWSIIHFTTFITSKLVLLSCSNMSPMPQQKRLYIAALTRSSFALNLASREVMPNGTSTVKWAKRNCVSTLTMARGFVVEPRSA